MIHRNVQMPPLTLRRLASCSALLALAMAPVVSRAQANPLTVTAGESLTYDNNFLRRPKWRPLRNHLGHLFGFEPQQGIGASDLPG
jgi:hypothetical protein